MRALLTAIEQKSIPVPGFDAGRRNQLLTNPDADIRRRAEALLSHAPVDPDRQPLLDRYRQALSGPRDPARGREVFRANCSSCHQLEGVGIVRGPELIAATQGRADETLLLDILEPSAQITVGYRTYQIVTRDGAIFSGILTGESATSVTLPDEDGFPQTLLRKDIASMEASDVSIMPANFADVLEPAAVADLLAYLRAIAHAGPGPVLTLFDDDPGFAELLTEGDGTATVVTTERYAGTASLLITPPQRFAAQLGTWNHPIVEHPDSGSYRYLRFAWKAPAAEGVMLELAASGEWPPADQPLRRYVAGQNTTGWAARSLASQPPADWTVVTVDLWRDFGAFTLTGLAPTALGGSAYFDQLQLLQQPDPNGTVGAATPP
ncbi:MAG: c-type cytochrome [Verrucomicrobia bacterium]|nr:c-type cytochrome [Verrucomicrobiota bacterium]